jgi:hypothetical protein
MRYLHGTGSFLLATLLYVGDFFRWLYKASELEYLVQEFVEDVAWGIGKLQFRMGFEILILLLGGIVVLVVEWDLLLHRSTILFAIVAAFTLRMIVRIMRNTIAAYRVTEELERLYWRHGMMGHF